MKKLFLLLLSMILMLSLAACSGKKALIEGEGLLPSDVFSEPSTETFAVSESSTEASVTSEPSSETTAISKPSSETTTVSKPSSEGSADSEPSSETTAISKPSSETTTVSKPSSEGSADSEPSSETTAISKPSSETTAVSEPSDADVPEKSTEPTSESGGILVAYFSWSGNTEQMAQMIQAETAGDLFEIEPATPYTDSYNTLLDIAQQEQADNARPKLASQVENWESYDVVFVGYPDWWSDAPMLIYSFLESYDWEGKALVPFCISGGSGFGRSLGKLPDSAPGATIAEGLHLSSSRVDGAAGEITAWIDRLNLA